MLVANKHSDDPGRPRHGIIPWENIFFYFFKAYQECIYLDNYGNACIYVQYDKRPYAECVFDFFSKVIGTKNLVFIRLTVVS